MTGIIYIGCTPVTRYIIHAHRKHFDLRKIPISGIVNINQETAITKANYDHLYDFKVKYNIPIHYCNNVNAPETLAWIKSYKPTLIIQSGWSQKFGSKLLAIPKYGCIGEHPAPIPKGRGAACVNWAIINGETDWGDSFFKMEEQYDAGPVYAQKYFVIEHFDTCKTVYDKVARTAGQMIKENLQSWYKGKFKSLKLDESKATYYKKRVPEDGRLSFTWDPATLQRYVNALTKPYPGAFFEFDKQRVIVWSSEIGEGKTRSPAGTFLSPLVSGGIKVAVGKGHTWIIHRLQIENEPEVSGKDFYNLYIK